METKRWKKIEAIYHSASLMNENEREAFLQNICADDSTVLAEVRALLQSNLSTAEFLKDNALEIGMKILAEKEKKMGDTIDDFSSDSTAHEESLVGGRFRLIKPLGEGGIGEVFLADDTRLRKKVVIKFLHPSTKNVWLIEKFENEAIVQGRIDDFTNVAFPLDQGRLNEQIIFEFEQNGQAERRVLAKDSPYLVMEFIDGSNVGELIKQALLNSEQIAFDLVANIIKQAGNGVDEVHRANLVHRDLKPANLMLSKKGLLKVIDFGITRDLTDKTSLTPVGTPSYMPIEQLNRQEVSPATDVFALAVIAYQLLTLRLPFEASDGVAHILSRQEGVKVKPRLFRTDLPKEAETLILRALAYEPGKRPQSALEFGDKLAEILTRKSQSAPIIVHNKPNYMKYLRAAAAVLLLALAGFAGWLWFESGTKPVQADELVISRPQNPVTENKPANISQPQTTSTGAKPVYDAERSFPTGKAPDGMIFAQIGLTFWRSRPATPQDDRSAAARNTFDTAEFVSERKDDFIGNGEKIYFSIESMTGNFLSDKGGYVYVINREQYADGTFGKARLIFPTQLTYNGNNLLRPGEPVILPRDNNQPFVINRSSDQQTAETYTIIVSPWAFQLPEPLSRNVMILPDNLVAEWEGKYKNKMYRAALRNGIGNPRTIREQEVMSRSTDDTAQPLTQSESNTFPQTIYKGAVKIGNPAMFTVALRFRD